MKYLKKKFIPYARQNITDEDIKAVEEILKKPISKTPKKSGNDLPPRLCTS